MRIRIILNKETEIKKGNAVRCGMEDVNMQLTSVVGIGVHDALRQPSCKMGLLGMTDRANSILVYIRARAEKIKSDGYTRISSIFVQKRWILGFLGTHFGSKPEKTAIFVQKHNFGAQKMYKCIKLKQKRRIYAYERYRLSAYFWSF